jgi:CHAD domain-containing protein
MSTPPTSRPPQLTPADPARLALQIHLATHVRALCLQEERVRENAPDSVHKMRVAGRRLRSCLHTFKPLVEPGWADFLRGELRWLAGNLSGFRDKEVLLARLTRDLDALLPEAGPHADVAGAKEHVDEVLGKQLAAARTEVVDALESGRYGALRSALIGGAANPHTVFAAEQPSGEVLPPLVKHTWKRLARDATGLTPDSPDAIWHETRIAAKKARYAAEACVAVFGSPAAELAGQLTRITEILGEHQDAAVAAQTVLELATTPEAGTEPGTLAAGTGFALGALYAEQRHALERARTEFSRIWPDVARKRWRRWL